MPDCISGGDGSKRWTRHSKRYQQLLLETCAERKGFPSLEDIVNLLLRRDTTIWSTLYWSFNPQRGKIKLYLPNKFYSQLWSIQSCLDRKTMKGCLFSYLASVTSLHSLLHKHEHNFSVSKELFQLPINGELKVTFLATHTKRIFFQTWCQKTGVEEKSLSWHNKKMIEGSRHWSFLVISSVGTWKCCPEKLYKNTSRGLNAHCTG